MQCSRVGMSGMSISEKALYNTSRYQKVMQVSRNKILQHVVMHPREAETTKCLHLKTVEVRAAILHMTDVQSMVKCIPEMTIPITLGKVLCSGRQLKRFLNPSRTVVVLLLFKRLLTSCHPTMHCWMHQASD